MTIAIFGSLELYFTNYEELWFANKDIVIVTAFLAIGCFVIFMTIGLLLRGMGREIYSSILFALGLALYIQGNYANMDYGVLDGKAIDWNAYPIYAVFDTVGWFALVIVVLMLWIQRRNLFYRLQRVGSIWIIAVQSVTLITLMLTTDALKTEKPDYYLSDEGLYEVSSSENIIIFVLDTFDDTYFQEIVEAEPDKYKAIFEDFTHFNNAAAGGWMTNLGMPAIITGEHYPGKITYQEYIEQTFNRDKLYSTLQKQNYDVRIFSNALFVPDGSTKLVDNQISTGYSVSSYPKLTRNYLSLILYKHMPHVLKKFFWIYTGEFEQYKEGNSAEGYIINDAAYFDRLKKNGLSVTQDKNIFRLIHMNGVHPPYSRGEYFQSVEAEEASAILQGKGVLYIIENYISMMKELGVYDAATIVIMADHGAETAPALGAHGVLLVKEKNHKGVYTESAAPVSYYELHATVFHALGIATEELSFFEVPEDVRKRYVYGYEAADNGKTTAVEYVIEGNLNSGNILRKTGIVLQPLDRKEYYEYGENLTFGGDNTVQPFVRKGVSFIGVGYLWTDGNECECEFEFKKAPKKNLLVTLDIMTVYKNDGPQKAIIYANGVQCARWKLLGGEVLQFVVPGTLVKEDNVLTLRIELPNAASPLEYSKGNTDPRMLALALRGLRIDETDKNIEDTAIKAPGHYDFGQNGNLDEICLLGGWHGAEDGHQWTSALAELRCKIEKDCDYQMELQYVSHAASGNTNVYVNDTLLSELDGSESIATVTIPSAILREDGNQVISFETPDAISPKEAGENGDGRILGICVYSLDLRAMEIE